MAAESWCAPGMPATPRRPSCPTSSTSQPREVEILFSLLWFFNACLSNTYCARPLVGARDTAVTLKRPAGSLLWRGTHFSRGDNKSVTTCAIPIFPLHHPLVSSFCTFHFSVIQSSLSSHPVVCVTHNRREHRASKEKPETGNVGWVPSSVFERMSHCTH